MKFMATIIVIILMLCGGALWFLAGGSLNEFIKAQIETIGKEITEQTVSVASVDIELSKGSGSLLDISLANPEKYSQPHAFSLKEATLDINVKSLSSTPIIIDAVIIKSPNAFVEINESGQSNIKDIIDIIEKNIPKTSPPTTSEKGNSDTQPKIRISKMILAGTALTLKQSALGDSEHKFTIPDITLTNIGGADGLPANELGSVIMKQALSAIWKQTKNVQKEKLKEKATEKLKDKAKKKLSELFNKL